MDLPTGSSSPKNSRVWGKRCRPTDGTDPLHFSELSDEQKKQRRREERQEKKERDRTLSYFQGVQKMLQPGSATHSGGPASIASAVDGFFQELVKLLKADPTFHLLRNGTICQTIELALQNALLLHSKTLLFVFLGHIMDLITSPVASYVVETLLASLSQGLSGLAAGNQGQEPSAGSDFVAEMCVGGQGAHTGSGVPSTATLLSHVVDEVTEAAETVLTHAVASRATRSLILMLGGFSIRNAPSPHADVKFFTLLDPLAVRLMEAVEQGYQAEYGTFDPAETWITVAQTPATSFIVQSLLRVSVEGTRADLVCRQRLEELTYHRRPLLQHLLLDPMGCHIFQSFLKVPTPKRVCEAGDTAVQSLLQTKNTSQELSNEVWLEGCAWGRALSCFRDVWRGDAPLARQGPEGLQRSRFILQDLALFAPSAMHLVVLWREVIRPELSLFWREPSLCGALVAFVRKASMDGPWMDSVVETSPKLKPSEGSEESESDRTHGARTFSVPVAIQKEICDAICTSLKSRGPERGSHCQRGAAGFLLVQYAVNPPVDWSEREKSSTSTSSAGHGPDVARCILRFYPAATAILQHSVEKLRVEDIQLAAHHRQGSLALQQYLRAVALAAPRTGCSAPAPTRSGPLNLELEKSAITRFYRRVSSFLSEWAKDKYAAYIVEELYRVGSLCVKEHIVLALQPLLHHLRKHLSVKDSSLDDASNAETHFFPIVKKVLTTCCVEQYVFRPEEWRKMAERQCHVQQLMSTMTSLQ